VKLHLNNRKENEFGIEEEWKNLQNILKSKWKFRTIKRRNRRKYLKILDDQLKQLVETKKKLYYKWLTSKKLEVKLEYKRNSQRNSQKRSKKNTKNFLGQT
jgi:hypothetical protein